MFECWSKIILLVLLGLEPYLQILKPKCFKPKISFPIFCRLCINRSDRVRSTDPVDRRARLCKCARRPTARADRALVSALCLFRSTESADRFPPTVRNMTVGGRPARSTGSCQKVWQTPTALFSDRFCWDLTPTNLFSCFTLSFIPYI